MARKFLYVFAALIVMTIAGAFAYRLYGPQLLRAALVPSVEFAAQPTLPVNAWAERKMWFARPDIGNDPAQWIPDSVRPESRHGKAAIFFIHPTSFLDRSTWNAPLDNAEANGRAELFLRGQATAFNGVGQVWAPRYRQATFGAFLTGQREAQLALDAAYVDVRNAFDAFIAQAPADAPIIVAGHSQGALHLMRLLRERVAGRPIAKRIVAAYVVGWPISVTADMPSLGLPQCERADQPGCILSWQSFAEPADPSQVIDTFDASSGPTGVARRGTAMVCTNPLTGTPNVAAPASANLGTIIPSADLKTGTLAVGKVPARCTGRGLLMIGAPPEGIGTYVLPGNNYHVFDYSLFWGSIRADAARRLAAFEAR